MIPCPQTLLCMLLSRTVQACRPGGLHREACDPVQCIPLPCLRVAWQIVLAHLGPACSSQSPILPPMWFCGSSWGPVTEGLPPRLGSSLFM